MEEIKKEEIKKMEEGVIGGTDGFIVAFVTSNTERDKDAFLSAVTRAWLALRETENHRD